jgi:hypothetical protein
MHVHKHKPQRADDIIVSGLRNVETLTNSRRGGRLVTFSTDPPSRGAETGGDLVLGNGYSPSKTMWSNILSLGWFDAMSEVRGVEVDSVNSGSASMGRSEFDTKPLLSFPSKVGNK